MNTREIWKRFDIPLFAVVLLLCVFGVALISSAIAGNPTLVDHPRRQATFLIIGLVILFLSALCGQSLPVKDRRRRPGAGWHPDPV